MPAGLCPSADHAGHQPIGDQNLQLSGLFGLSAPPCSLGVGQQLQLEPRLCYLPGGLPGRAGKRREWQTHFICRCVGPYRRFFFKSSSPLYLPYFVAAFEDHLLCSWVPQRLRRPLAATTPHLSPLHAQHHGWGKSKFAVTFWLRRLTEWNVQFQ